MEKLHDADEAKVKQLCAACRIVIITKAFTKKNLKIDLDITKNKNMAVETTEERNQNMNGRNDGDREIIEEQKINDAEQNTNYSNEEEMGVENNKIGHAPCVTKEVNNNWRDTKSVYETLIVVSKMLNAWENEDVNFKVVNKHDRNVELEENWARGVRTTVHHKRNYVKVESFLKIKTSEQLHRLKQKVGNMCKEKGV